MSNPVLIGGDSGTSATKFAAYDLAGNLIVASDSFGGYPILGDGIGSSEQDIVQIWLAVKAALADLTTKLFARGYTKQDLLDGAMAATFQMHTSVPLDENFQPIRKRVILWNNAAGGDIVKQLIDHFGIYHTIELLNNHPTPGYSLIHSLLVKRYMPVAWTQVRHIGLLNSLFGLKLTGNHVLNRNDAAGTIAFDVAHDCWCREVADFTGVSTEFWPEVIAPNGLVGYIRGIEADTGIPDGVRLYSGLGDCAAGALGSGVVLPGQVCAILGTAGIFVIPTEKLIVDADGGGRVQSYGYVEGRSHLLSTNLSAGGCVEQFRRMVLMLLPDDIMSERDLNTALPLSRLDDQAMRFDFGNSELLIDTRIAGERTGQPGWNPEARGRVFGLSPSTTAGQYFLALLKGVIFQQMLHAEICSGYGVPMNKVTLMGGGSKSQFYSALLTAGLKAINPEIEVRTLASGQGGGARGMALLAGKGAGLINDLAQVAGNVVVSDPISTMHPIFHELDMVAPMAAQYRKWFKNCYSV